MRRFLVILILQLIVAAAWAGPKVPPFDLGQARWETGQIIAISEPAYDTSTLFFELGTGSHYGHIGIVSVEEQGVFVYHSDPPHSQKTPLAVFLAKAVKTTRANVAEIQEQLEQIEREDGSTEAVRLAERLIRVTDLFVTQLQLKNPLTDHEKQALISYVDERVEARVPYNHEQVRTEGLLNCSEFTYEAFEKIGRAGVGREMGFPELNMKAVRGMAMKLYGEVPAHGKVISPVSIVLSDRVEAVSSNLPVRIVSDREILNKWLETGMLDRFLSRYKISPAMSPWIIRVLASNRPYRKDLSCGLKLQSQ